MKTTVYICQLTKGTQDAIKSDLLGYLTHSGYTPEEISEILENALSGRLVDLEENINIEKYLNRG